MTVETEVANLTTAVDSLTSAVNVSKATLDASVADAQAHKTGAQAAQTGSEAARDQAGTHAANVAAAIAAAEAVTAQDVSGGTEARTFTEVCRPILGNLADLGPDYFLFRQGEHRRSYYRERVVGDPLYTGALGNDLGEVANEAAARAVSGATTNDFYHNTTDGKFYKLNATTGQTEIFRGPKAEFPQSYEIRAEAARVIIFDEQTGSMWMVFKYGSASTWGGMNLHSHATTTTVAFEGGCLLIGQSSGDGCLNVADFCADTGYKHHWGTAYGGPYLGNIAERNDAKGYSGPVANVNPRPILQGAVNAVAATILPDAPANPDRNGMREITWAVATDGGVSVCKNGGAVIDIAPASTSYRNTRQVAFTEDGKVAFTLSYQGVADDSFHHIFELPDADLIAGWDRTTAATSVSGLAHEYYGAGSYIPALGSPTAGSNLSPTTISVSDRLFIKTKGGVSTFWRNPNDPASGMVAYQAGDFVTSVMPGDVKGAWFNEWGQAGTLVGANVIDDDFTSYADQAAAEAAGWSFGTDATGGWYFDAVNKKAVADGLQTSTVYLSKQLTTVAGAYYVGQFVVGGEPCYSGFWDNANGGGSSLTLEAPFSRAIGSHAVNLKAVDATSHFSALGAAGSVDEIESLKVDLATPDRSVNGKGLILNGSLTQDAEGRVSGFSASNYAEQPYNADLDFGTGDFYVAFDFISAAVSSRTFVSYGASGTFKWQVQHDASGVLRAYVGANIVSYSGAIDGAKRHGVLCRISGVAYLYIDGLLVGSIAAADNVSVADATLLVGLRHGGINALGGGSIRRVCIGAGAPSPAQIKVMASWDGMGLAGTFKDQFFDETSGDLLVLTSTHLHRVDGDGRVTSEAATANYVSQYFNREALA